GTAAEPKGELGSAALPDLANDLHHSARQRGEIVGHNGERRRQVNDRAERPDEYPLPHEARPQRVEVGDPLELDHADRTLDAHIHDARKAATWRETIDERSRDRLDLR